MTETRKYDANNDQDNMGGHSGQVSNIHKRVHRTNENKHSGWVHYWSVVNHITLICEASHKVTMQFLLVIIHGIVAKTTLPIPLHSQLGQMCTVALDDRCRGSRKKCAGFARRLNVSCHIINN